ncbi:MAG: anti-sigma-factor antagonist [Chthoniobacteraceae bacterium]|nr:anti-sigma-factor antagonist [Chthoniobacteraceae bacterium]
MCSRWRQESVTVTAIVNTSMQIQEERQGDVQIITIDDHLDTSTATLFEARLLGMIDRGTRRILLDCTALSYVNSAGLKVLLLATKKLEPFHGELILCSLSQNVLMIFEMIGFTRIMKIVPDRETALKLFTRLPVS